MTLAASVYPKTYPFEKNKPEHTPPDLPDTDPDESKALADKDYAVGGYYNRFFKCDPYADDRLTFTIKGLSGDVPDASTHNAGFWECRGTQLGNLRKGKFVFAKTSNCTTSKGLKFDSKTSKLKGMYGTQKVCEAGSCCKDIDGQYEPFSLHGILDGKLAKSATENGCPKLPTSIAEPFYCNYVMMGYNCLQYFKAGKTNARHSNKPCHDVFWIILNTCALYKDSKTYIEAGVLAKQRAKSVSRRPHQRSSEEGWHCIPFR